MSQNRTRRDRGYVDPSKLPKGPNGRALCRWCGQEVPKGLRTFCSDKCVDEWRVRTDPGYVRHRLFERDRGVCCRCGTDTEALAAFMHRFHRETYPMRYSEYQRACRLLRLPRNRDTLWDAHHIVPVVEGGGECGLDGYQTLCCTCHAEETDAMRARQAQERRQQKRKAKPEPEAIQQAMALEV